MKTQNINGKMNKKGMTPLILAALIIIGGLILTGAGFLSIGGLTSSTVDGYVDVPHFATIKCEQSGASKTYSASVTAGGQWLDLPANTAEWNIKFNKAATIYPTQLTVYTCPQKGIANNCKKQVISVETLHYGFTLGVVPSTSFVYAHYQHQVLPLWPLADEGHGSFEVTYQPFVLVRYDSLRGGQEEISTAKGCELSTDDAGWTNRVLSAVGITIPDGIARDNKLNPGEKFNYISGTVTRLMMGNTQDYNGKTGYCIYSNAQATIYPIKQLTTASATYNIVDVSGTALGTAQCCDGDNLPDKTCVDGRWESTKGTGCNIVNPCEGTEWRRDLNTPKTTIRYQCVSGACQPATKQVECSQDSDCRTNQRCSTSSWTCVQAGDTKINIPGSERLQTNEQDCTKAGNKWVAKTTEHQAGICGILTLGLWNCGSTVVVEAHCTVPTPLWKQILWFLLIAGAIILAIKLLPPVFKAARGIARK